MNFSNVCRTCLSVTNLNPIFVDCNKHEQVSTEIYNATGIQINPEDGLPQNMCSICIEQITKTISFRQKCKQSETKLLRIKSNRNNDSNLTIVNIKIEDTTIDVKIESDSDIDYDEDNVPLQRLADVKQSNSVEVTLKSEDNHNLNISSEHPNTNAGISEKAKAARVKCRLCQKDLSVRSYDHHMTRAHPGADHGKVKCELCDTYVLPGKLKRHTKLAHGDDGLRCGYCKVVFSSKDGLILHVPTCRAKKKKRNPDQATRTMVECDECHKTMQHASLKLHKAVTHRGMGPVCEYCGKRFGNKFRLTEHYRAKHGVPKLKCKFCKFQSAGTMAMRDHERRHRGEKPFVCEQCGAKFHAAYLLAQHKQSHRKEKSVKCDLCPASFKTRNNMHMHKRTCHNTKTYRCTICARVYKCKVYAVKHMRHAHGANYSPEEM